MSSTLTSPDGRPLKGEAIEVVNTTGPTSANQTTGNTSLASIDTKLSSQATAANQTTLNTEIGATNESAAASDTATSGLNGLLKRIAQNITTLAGRFVAAATLA